MDKRQRARTQGRYSLEDDKKHDKDDEFRSDRDDNRQKVKKEYRTNKTPYKDRKFQKSTYSDSENRKGYNPGYGQNYRNRNSDPAVYQDTSNDKDNLFPKLGDSSKIEEIKDSGMHCLGATEENGKSLIFIKRDFMDYERSSEMLHKLLNETQWSEKEITIDGEKYIQPRLVAWFGPFPYQYSGVKLKPKQIPPIILQIKRDVEYVLRQENIDVELNSVLLNYYRNGKDSVAWHSDDETSMGIRPTIASVSLGETRRFELRKKPHAGKLNPPAEYVVQLTHGSLVVMDGAMQLDWQHRVPKEYHDKDIRINLTFRTVYALDRIHRPRISLENYIRPPHPKETKAEPFELKCENFPALSQLPHSMENLNLLSSEKEKDTEIKCENASNSHLPCDEVQNLDTSDTERSSSANASADNLACKNDDIWSDVSSIESFVPKKNTYTQEIKSDWADEPDDENQHNDSPEEILNDKRIVEALQKNYDFIAGNQKLFTWYQLDELDVLMKVTECSELLPIDVIQLLSNRMEQLINNAQRSKERVFSNNNFRNNPRGRGNFRSTFNGRYKYRD